MKVVVTRETGGYSGGRLEINEIKFFEGILAQTEYPRVDMKMKSPRTPSPQLVTCSSFTEQTTHCFRAFDGDSTSNSAWITIPVGSNRKSLTPQQWITFDFGDGLGIRPTAIRIVCGGSDPSNAKGCPMTFTLMGSEDNIKYTTLLNIDMYDYNDEFNSPDGKTFYLLWESPKGRENGHRCGSCDTGPDFVCSTAAFDSTCASRYCGVGGYCEKIPICPAGWYLASSAPAAVAFTSREGIHIEAERDRGSIACAPCEGGIYGDHPGLLRSNCSGLCEQGYYCTGGSSTPRQYSCGASNVYCPAGSSNPIPIGAGEKCIAGKIVKFAKDQKHCYETAKCALGHYCVNGLEYRCPAGRYGSSEGLMSPECTGLCLPGEYCPEGSISPTLCPHGYYCAQVIVIIFCRTFV